MKIKTVLSLRKIPIFLKSKKWLQPLILLGFQRDFPLKQRNSDSHASKRDSGYKSLLSLSIFKRL